jgi:hypothetical protein
MFLIYSFSLSICNKKHSKQKLHILKLCGEEYKHFQCVVFLWPTSRACTNQSLLLQIRIIGLFKLVQSFVQNSTLNPTQMPSDMV